ncbi:hypothetical protein HKCCE4037_18595 [Rhodobacterales bacterium HKCCE4037]|nr:hypothetical protein [Rhodobacterales bacterium HKCCE4037]
MIRRILPSGLLALCLVLTSLAAVVAETRMAAAGGFCGTGSPRILLDDAGLPILDAEGEAIASQDCGLCHLAIAEGAPAPTATRGFLLIPAPILVAAPLLSPLSPGLLRHARAPPHMA